MCQGYPTKKGIAIRDPFLKKLNLILIAMPMVVRPSPVSPGINTGRRTIARADIINHRRPVYGRRRYKYPLPAVNRSAMACVKSPAVGFGVRAHNR